MNDLNRPLLGEPNAPCRTCGSPLAEDQRYCLQCGNRRAEARLPFLDILARQVPAAAVAETTVTRRRGPAWLGDMSPSSTFVAGVACLLLALGVGVLIGGWGNGDSATAGPPQVISVGGAVAPAAAAAPASNAAPASTTAPATAAAAKSKKKSSSSGSGSSAGGSKATNSTVKSLDSTSGTDYSKKSSKLPKTLGTGGKAPAKDNKPAAGGGDFQTIG
jgi:hypothetical protein